jgi:hypothetical protein
LIKLLCWVNFLITHSLLSSSPAESEMRETATVPAFGAIQLGSDFPNRFLFGEPHPHHAR